MLPPNTPPIKFLEINLTKDVQNLTTENCKTLLREIFKDTNEWKGTPCSWTRDLI